MNGSELNSIKSESKNELDWTEFKKIEIKSKKGLSRESIMKNTL